MALRLKITTSPVLPNVAVAVSMLWWIELLKANDLAFRPCPFDLKAFVPQSTHWNMMVPHVMRLHAHHATAPAAGAKTSVTTPNSSHVAMQTLHALIDVLPASQRLELMKQLRVVTWPSLSTFTTSFASVVDKPTSVSWSAWDVLTSSTSVRQTLSSTPSATASETMAKVSAPLAAAKVLPAKTQGFWSWLVAR